MYVVGVVIVFGAVSDGNVPWVPFEALGVGLSGISKVIVVRLAEFGGDGLECVRA